MLPSFFRFFQIGYIIELFVEWFAFFELVLANSWLFLFRVMFCERKPSTGVLIHESIVIRKGEKVKEEAAHKIAHKIDGKRR